MENDYPSNSEIKNDELLQKISMIKVRENWFGYDTKGSNFLVPCCLYACQKCKRQKILA
jgi:hypothetical protein